MKCAVLTLLLLCLSSKCNSSAVPHGAGNSLDDMSRQDFAFENDASWELLDTDSDHLVERMSRADSIGRAEGDAETESPKTEATTAATKDLTNKIPNGDTQPEKNKGGSGEAPSKTTEAPVTSNPDKTTAAPKDGDDDATTTGGGLQYAGPDDNEESAQAPGRFRTRARDKWQRIFGTGDDGDGDHGSSHHFLDNTNFNRPWRNIRCHYRNADDCNDNDNTDDDVVAAMPENHASGSGVQNGAPSDNEDDDDTRHHGFWDRFHFFGFKDHFGHTNRWLNMIRDAQRGGPSWLDVMRGHPREHDSNQRVRVTDDEVGDS